MLGDGGRGSILTASPFWTAVRSGYLLRTAACCINTWYLVSVPGIIRGTRGLRIIRKTRNACFYMEPRIRFYTRARKFKNEVTNRWGKKGPFLNLKKSCIINGRSNREYLTMLYRDRWCKQRPLPMGILILGVVWFHDYVDALPRNQDKRSFSHPRAQYIQQ